MESDNYQVTLSLNDLWNLKSQANFGEYSRKEIVRLKTENEDLKQKLLDYETPQPPPDSSKPSIRPVTSR